MLSYRKCTHANNMVVIQKNLCWYLVFFQAVIGIAVDASVDFVFAFLQPQSDEMTGSTPYLLITTASTNPVEVTTTVPGLSFHNSTIISGRSMANISLPTNIYLTSNSDDKDKTIIIHSEFQISVNAMYIYQNYRSTGFSVFPTTHLGQIYFVSSYIPDSSEWSEYSITALEEGTQVIIENVEQGTSNQVIIPAYESYLVKDNNDLTGIRITADKPISVMSGCTGAHVGSQAGGPEFMAQNLPPVSRLGTSYVLAQFLYRTSGFVSRVIATEENTDVKISHGTLGLSSNTITLNTPGTFHEEVSDSEMTTIVSTKPVLVAQFAKSHHTDTIGDTFMLIVRPVPGTEMGEISFPITTLATSSDQKSYISITTDCSNSHLMTLDGIPIANSGVLQTSLETTSGTTQYCVLRLMVSHGVHTVGTVRPGIPYEAIVYGFGIKYVAYAFSLWGESASKPNKLSGPFEATSITCDNSRMVVLLNSSYIEPDHFRDVHLLDPSCFGETINNSTIRLSSDFNECATKMIEQDSNLVFYNKLIYKAPRGQNSSGDIPRYFDLSIELTCTVPRRGNSSLGPFIGPINGDEAGFGNLMFSLQMFNDSNYSNVYNSDDFPVMIDEGQTIFFAASVNDVNDVMLSIEFCKATPSRNPNDAFEHIIIMENGCGKDDPVTFYKSPNKLEQRFSTSIHSYFDNEPMIYIHCSMIVCSNNDTKLCPPMNTNCSTRGPRAIGSRYKHSPSPFKDIVSTSGPLLIKTPQSNTEGIDSMTTGITLAVVGGATLLLGLFIIVAIVLKKFLNRKISSYATLKQEVEMDELGAAHITELGKYMPL